MDRMRHGNWCGSMSRTRTCASICWRPGCHGRLARHFNTDEEQWGLSVCCTTLIMTRQPMAGSTQHSGGRDLAAEGWSRRAYAVRSITTGGYRALLTGQALYCRSITGLIVAAALIRRNGFLHSQFMNRFGKNHLRGSNRRLFCLL